MGVGVIRASCPHRTSRWHARGVHQYFMWKDACSDRPAIVNGAQFLQTCGKIWRARSVLNT